MPFLVASCRTKSVISLGSLVVGCGSGDVIVCGGNWMSSVHDIMFILTCARGVSCM